MPASPPPLDALIIGAGWSGLTCALQLAKAGKKVLCLEARQRLGGRAFTHTWNEDTPMDNNDRTLGVGEKAGYAVDFGCSYIHGYEEGNPVKEIAKRYGVNVFVPAARETQIVGVKGPLSKSQSARLQSNLQAAQAAAKAKAKALSSSSLSSSSSSPATPLSTFLFDRHQSPLFSGLATQSTGEGEKTEASSSSSSEEEENAVGLARMLHVPFGTEIENVSLNHFGYEENFGGTDGIPEGGFSRLIELMANDLKSSGGQIQLGQEVRKISRGGQNSSSSSGGGSEGVQVQVGSKEKEETSVVEAKTVIVTMPLSVLQSKGNDFFEPRLDVERERVIQKTSVGNLNKVLLTYQQPWWSLDYATFIILPNPAAAASSSPSALHELLASTTLVVNSLCSANSGLPAQLTSSSLVVMIGGQAGKEVEGYSRTQVADALDHYLSSRIQSTSQKAPLTHSFYSRWQRQEFTRGATTTPVTLGNHPSDFAHLAKPDWNGSLYFAGEHCEVNHRGSIAGAVVSAQTASKQVLKHLDTAPLAKH